MRWRTILALLLLWSGVASAAEIADATGRTVTVPDNIAHILPAGPPAAVLLASIAPDLMIGWPSALPEAARVLLAPPADKLPQVPRLTGRDDVTEKVKALKPDLILDYGTVSPRYADLARATQQSTGIPTILLDGSLAGIPSTMRSLGALLHRKERGETLARFAEAILALPAPKGAPPKVGLCARRGRADRGDAGHRRHRRVRAAGLAGAGAGWAGDVPPDQHRGDPRAGPRHADLLRPGHA